MSSNRKNYCSADPMTLNPFAQDSEFVHFWKNVCILGGLATYAPFLLSTAIELFPPLILWLHRYLGNL